MSHHDNQQLLVSFLCAEHDGCHRSWQPSATGAVAVQVLHVVKLCKGPKQSYAFDIMDLHLYNVTAHTTLL